MLRWAMRYLSMVVVIGVAFGVLQGSELFRAPPAATGTPRPVETQALEERPAYNEHVVEAGAHGHFVLEAVVNGEPVDFLVDTGASDLVLSLEDAGRLGFRPQALAFTRRYQTANGEIRAAPVTLRELRIGQNRLFDVDGSVSEVPMPISVLGVSLLNRFGGYRVEDDRLYLYW